MRAAQKFLREIQEIDELAKVWERALPLLHEILAAQHDWMLEQKPLPIELLVNEEIMRSSTQIQDLVKAAKLLAKLHDSRSELKLLGMKFVLAPDSCFPASSRSVWFALR